MAKHGHPFHLLDRPGPNRDAHALERHVVGDSRDEVGGRRSAGGGAADERPFNSGDRTVIPAVCAVPFARK